VKKLHFLAFAAKRALARETDKMALPPIFDLLSRAVQFYHRFVNFLLVGSQKSPLTALKIFSLTFLQA